MTGVVLAALSGLLLGGLINTLADCWITGAITLPPRYADGAVRPRLAWFGCGAFLCGLRRRPASHGQVAPPLSLRYPLTELCLATLFVVAELKLSALDPLTGLAWRFMLAVFVLVAVIDIERRRIPLALIVLPAALSLAASVLLPQAAIPLPSAIVGAMTAGGTFALAYLGGRVYLRIVARRTLEPAPMSALGSGDVCLAAVAGLVVGFPHALIVVVLSLLLGGAVALAWLVRARLRRLARGRFTQMPYAPHIVASTAVVMTFHGDIGRMFGG